MSKIIQIRVFRYAYAGFVGLDLETKKKRYFYYPDEHSGLVEFNPNTTTNKYLIAFVREHENSVASTEIKDFVEQGINVHREYNIANGYPTEFLDKNSSYLSINPYAYAIDNFLGLASYNPIANKIEYSKDREIVYNHMIHELGHMKATKYKIYDEANMVYVISGLTVAMAEVEPIFLPNGDIFYRIKSDNLEYDMKSKYIEEIMNDYDCSLFIPKYKVAYPDFGADLNYLCDNRLLMARYGSGIDELYTSLLTIEPSLSLLADLQDSLNAASEGNANGYNAAKRILARYKNKKKQL